MSGGPALTRRAALTAGAAATGALALAAAPAAAAAVAAPSEPVPVYNPVADFYRAVGYPAWTDSIPWRRVYNVLAYGARPDGAGDNLAAFARAQADAVRDGGGVVYFPPGTYAFSDDLALAAGVTIRGGLPSGTGRALNPGYVPPTLLEFPRYQASPTAGGGSGTPVSTAFKRIRLADPGSAGNVGVVHLAVNRACIDLGDNGQTGTGWRAGPNRLVFGCTVRNAVRPAPQVPDLSGQRAWQRYTAGEAAAIRVSSAENALAANNRLLPATDNFYQNGYLLWNWITRKWQSVDGVLFDYDNRNGIVVNRPSAGTAAAPATAQSDPGLFVTGILVADNYVYCTGRTALAVGGQGTVCRNNDLHNQPGWRVPRQTVDGVRVAFPLDDNADHAVDLAGAGVIVEGNTYEAYPGLVVLGDRRFPLGDGQGIVAGDQGGTATVDAVLSGNSGNAAIRITSGWRISRCAVRDNAVTAGGIALAGTYRSPAAGAPEQLAEVSGNVCSGNRVAAAVNLTGYACTAANRIVDNRADPPGVGAIEVWGRAVAVGPVAATATPTTLSGNVGFVPSRTPSGDGENGGLDNPPGWVALSAVAGAAHTAALQWPSAGAFGVAPTGYVVEGLHADGTWAPLPGPGARLGPQAGPLVRTVLGGLTPATSYTVRVRVLGADGESVPGESVSFTTAVA